MSRDLSQELHMGLANGGQEAPQGLLDLDPTGNDATISLLIGAPICKEHRKKGCNCLSSV